MATLKIVSPTSNRHDTIRTVTMKTGSEVRILCPEASQSIRGYIQVHVGGLGIAYVSVSWVCIEREDNVGRRIRRVGLKCIVPRVLVILPGPRVQGTDVLVGHLPVDADDVHPLRTV